MFVKKNYDSEEINDVTIDNSILDKTSSFKIISKIIKQSLLNIPVLSQIYLTDLVTLSVAFLYTSSFDLIAIQFGILFVNFFIGALLLRGLQVSFDNYSVLNKSCVFLKKMRYSYITNSWKLFILFVLIPIIAFTQLVFSLGLNPLLAQRIADYVLYASPSAIFSSIVHLNTSALVHMGKPTSAASLNVCSLVLHTVLLIVMFDLLGNSPYAAGIGSSLSSFISGVLGNFVLSVMTKKILTKNVIIDTEKNITWDSLVYGALEAGKQVYIPIILVFSLLLGKTELLISIFLVNLLSVFHLLCDALGKTMISNVQDYKSKNLTDKYLNSLLVICSFFTLSLIFFIFVLKMILENVLLPPDSQFLMGSKIIGFLCLFIVCDIVRVISESAGKINESDKIFNTVGSVSFLVFLIPMEVYMSKQFGLLGIWFGYFCWSFLFAMICIVLAKKYLYF